MSFPRYPKYKDSGVDWLGEVPEHWPVIPFKYLVRLRSGGTPSKEKVDYWDGEVPWASSKDLKSDAISDTEDHITDKAVADGVAELVPKGSILVVVRGMILAHTFPVTRALAPMAINQDLKAVTPQDHLDSDYLEWMLRGGSTESLRRVDRAAHGTTVLRLTDWISMPFPLPTLREQQAIQRFLVSETAKIDDLIAEQQRLIELLKEKRQAVISHAVTKGLNPNVRMKDSGIEWLGELPEHWTITPLKWLTDPERPIMYGIVLPGPDVDEGIPILKGGNVRPSRMNIESVARTTPAIEAPYARARLKRGDLVYSIRGSIGDCEMVPAELEGANITQDVARVATAEAVCAPWVRWALLASAVREELASGSLGAAVRGVNIFDLKRANIPTPPTVEQFEIAEFLEIATRKLDTLAAEAQRAIDLLQERRTALISAAVTGQIDVRGFQPALAA